MGNKLVNTTQLAKVDLEQNIRDVYELTGNNTVNWYKDANAMLLELCFELDVDMQTLCGVVAVLSPSLRWEKNVKQAIAVITDYNAGVTGIYMAYGANVNKALRILDGENPLDVMGKGKKVRAFFHNLLYPECNLSYITVDRHICNICVNGKLAATKKSGDYVPTPKAYDVIQSAFVSVAFEYGILPHCLQSAIWSYCADKTGF